MFALILGILGAFGVPCWGAPARYSLEKDGYVSDSRHENRDQAVDLELIEVPIAIRERQYLRDKIFDTQLTTEFSSRYKELFGNTAAEVNYKNTQRFGAYDSAVGEWSNVQADQDKERAFAEYMGRRMLEYHIDNYSKSKPELKEAYEFKEKVTTQEVTVAPGYGIKSNYSISGNYLDIQLINPFVGSRAKMDFGSSLSGPETRISVEKWVSTRVNIEGQYALNDGIGKLIGRRLLTTQSAVSLTGSTYFKNEGPSVREHLGILGYSLGF